MMNFVFHFSLFDQSDQKHKNQLSCLFTFYWESKFLIGEKRNKFSVKTGFEELKKK